jgi:hypothetical protein
MTSDGTNTFNYDANGNMLTMGNKTLAYTQAHSNRCTGDGTRTFGYDASGRMTSRGGATLAYDFQSKMTGYSSETYRYNAANQRIVKTEAGETTYYINEGVNTLAEYASTGLLAEYIYGADLC